MRMKIRRKHVLVAVVLAAIGVMSAATLAWAAPNITNRMTPPASHVADGRSVRDCSTCHKVTLEVPSTDPTATPVPDPTGTPTPEPTATPSPDPTVTPSPDATHTPGACNGDDHGKKIGHHKGDSNNAKNAAHAAQKAKKLHKLHTGNTHDALHADSRAFGMAGGNGGMNHDHGQKQDNQNHHNS
jgi:hypothetical protein